MQFIYIDRSRSHAMHEWTPVLLLADFLANIAFGRNVISNLMITVQFLDHPNGDFNMCTQPYMASDQLI